MEGQSESPGENPGLTAESLFVNFHADVRSLWQAPTIRPTSLLVPSQTSLPLRSHVQTIALRTITGVSGVRTTGMCALKVRSGWGMRYGRACRRRAAGGAMGE